MNSRLTNCSLKKGTASFWAHWAPAEERSRLGIHGYYFVRLPYKLLREGFVIYYNIHIYEN